MNEKNPSRTPARGERSGELESFGGLSPFRELFAPGWRLPDFIDELFGPRTAAQKGRWAPAVDIAEEDQRYVITAELPGLSKDDVHIEVEDNVMTIRGEKRSEREEKKQKSRWVERSYGSFSRSFTLPANTAADRVSASFKDGVLSVELPKTEAAKPRVISLR